MADTAVDDLYNEFKRAVEIINIEAEPSLVSALQSNFSKALVLAAASYFEKKLTDSVADYCVECTKGNSLIISLVHQKVITRQYHSWFDWEKNNANKFHSLFGNDFKSLMTTKLREVRLENSIKSFMNLGSDRNRLVHQNFAAFLLEKTADEIYRSYQDALYFVEMVPLAFRECGSITSS